MKEVTTTPDAQRRTFEARRARAGGLAGWIGCSAGDHGLARE
jgi:hypothetical protein